jgi:hypothetical protein
METELSNLPLFNPRRETDLGGQVFHDGRIIEKG